MSKDSFMIELEVSHNRYVSPTPIKVILQDLINVMNAERTLLRFDTSIEFDSDFDGDGIAHKTNEVRIEQVLLERKSSAGTKKNPHQLFTDEGS